MATNSGGRGVFQGPDAIVAQNELRDLRRRLGDLEATQFLPTEIRMLYLTLAERNLWFDSTGLGVADQPFFGFAIVNGANGTPANLNGVFPRFNTSSAGAIGGADAVDHTHSVTSNVTSAATTGNESTHTHSVTSNVTSASNTGNESAHTHDRGAHSHAKGTLAGDNESAHTHGAGTLHAEVTGGDGSGLFVNQSASGNWTANLKMTATGLSWGGDTTAMSAGVDVVGSTAAGSAHGHTISGSTASDGTGNTGAGSSHNHSSPTLTNNAVTSGAGAAHNHSSPALTNSAVTSGGASNTENRPSFREVVPVMRL